MLRVRPRGERWRRVLALLGLGLLAACARAARPEGAQAPLAGLQLPLLPGGGRALAVQGQVGNTPARVVLEVAAPLSLVSEACFRQPPRGTGASVRVPQVRGGLRTVREVVLEGLRLGDRRVPTLVAGLQEATSACEVVLGSDALAPYALEVDPEARQVGLSPSRPPAAYASLPVAEGEEQRALPLTREPTTDWLLLPARLTQGEAQLTGPFVLTTGEETSGVSLEAATGEGLRGSAEPHLLPLEALELAPGLALSHVRPRGETGWSNAGALGVLGADVWGRFRATVDVKAGVLLLRRPAVGGEGRCAGPGGARSAEACLRVHQRGLGAGRRELGVTLWHPLPAGGHVALEARDAGGQPLGDACRVSFTFPPSGRGESLAGVLPPEGGAAPGCDWAQVETFVPGALQSGPLAACEGACLAVPAGEDLRCVCRPGSAGLTAPGGPGAPPPPSEETPEEPEPEDP